MGSVFIEGPAVTRAKEKLGLFEPTHRAAQVGAIHGEHPEILFGVTLHPTWYMSGLTICWYSVGIVIRNHPSCADLELVDRTERDPGRSGSFDHGGDDKTDDWDADHRASDNVQSDPDLEQKIPPRGAIIKLRKTVRIVSGIWIFRGHKLAY